ncbi:MAG TPA: TlpA disulfide reductase family protein [candidate division Zixibacteria bacterium]|nr:TlpA disulfide reductase family protein [candidate division Zixibacteria bacterium]
MKIPPLLICIPLLLASAACQKEDSPPPAQAPAAAAGLEVKNRLGEGMEFPRVTVADHLGNRYELRALLSKSRNILLLLDASCPACAEEAQKIQKFGLMNPKLNILGVSADSLSAVLAFKKRHALSFPILFDFERKLVPDYRYVSFPTLVLVGTDKRILKLYEGEIPPSEAGPLLQMLTGN